MTQKAPFADFRAWETLLGTGGFVIIRLRLYLGNLLKFKQNYVLFNNLTMTGRVNHHAMVNDKTKRPKGDELQSVY